MRDEGFRSNQRAAEGVECGLLLCVALRKPCETSLFNVYSCLDVELENRLAGYLIGIRLYC